MGMFDDIEIPHNIKNGPPAGDYQTKDLSNALSIYVLQENRLYVKLIKYNVIPESERTHPFLGMLHSEFIGLKDVEHHGYIELYNSKGTWRLKFTDGELMESKMIELSDDPDTTEPINDGKDSNGEISYWQGEEQYCEYNVEDCER
jgi:hypothetical protein